AGVSALWETGTCAFVIGQRAAVGIGKTGLHAGLQRGVKDRAQIASGQVGIRLQRQSSVGNLPVLRPCAARDDQTAQDCGEETLPNQLCHSPYSVMRATIFLHLSAGEAIYSHSSSA